MLLNTYSKATAQVFLAIAGRFHIPSVQPYGSDYKHKPNMGSHPELLMLTLKCRGAWTKHFGVKARFEMYNVAELARIRPLSDCAVTLVTLLISTISILNTCKAIY